MSSPAESSDIVLNIESSEPTHTASGGVRDVSGLDHAVGLVSDCSNYEWVYPCVLNVLTFFRGPTTLDGFFYLKYLS